MYRINGVSMPGFGIGFITILILMLSYQIHGLKFWLVLILGFLIWIGVDLVIYLTIAKKRKNSNHTKINNQEDDK
ncbi:MAG: hypothetical protein KAR38_17050 [Calditrichia bacterium]|nr:hypothetical protein [Calditrichia bacterium]